MLCNRHVISPNRPCPASQTSGHMPVHSPRGAAPRQSGDCTVSSRWMPSCDPRLGGRRHWRLPVGALRMRVGIRTGTNRKQRDASGFGCLMKRGPLLLAVMNTALAWGLPAGGGRSQGALKSRKGQKEAHKGTRSAPGQRRAFALCHLQIGTCPLARGHQGPCSAPDQRHNTSRRASA